MCIYVDVDVHVYIYISPSLSLYISMYMSLEPPCYINPIKTHQSPCVHPAKAMNRGDGAGEVTPWMHNSVALLGLFKEKNGPWVKLPVIIYWVTIY